MNINFYIENPIPFKEKGRDVSGVDCWGLVKLFYKKEFDIELPSYNGTYNDTSDFKIAETIECETKDKWLNVKSPVSGDVVLARMRNRPMHVGIFQEPYYMLHIEEGGEAKVEKINGIKWNKRIIGFYRLKK